MTLQYTMTVSYYKTSAYLFIQLWAFKFKSGTIQWKNTIHEQDFAT